MKQFNETAKDYRVETTCLKTGVVTSGEAVLDEKTAQEHVDDTNRHFKDVCRSVVKRGPRPAGMK